MIFTMRFTPHPQRQTAFEKKVAALGFLHGLCKKGSPWQNGIIERSHRTDNDELFHQLHFVSPEERRYQLCLWEMQYNRCRPHQALGGQPPLEVFRSEYRVHATSCMLM